MVTAAVNKLNNTAASTQPCFTPKDTLKSSDVFPPAITTAFISSCRAASMVKKLVGQPNFLRTSHNSILFTVSKAFARSTKATYRFCYCSLHFSWSWQIENITFVVDRSLHKPHWDSGKMFSETWINRRTTIIWASVLPAYDRRVIPLLLLHSSLSRWKVFSHLWIGVVFAQFPNSTERTCANSVRHHLLHISVI